MNSGRILLGKTSGALDAIACEHLPNKSITTRRIAAEIADAVDASTMMMIDGSDKEFLKDDSHGNESLMN